MLIVGLGNPGKNYEKTRHNIGYMFVDSVANYFGLKYIVDKKHQCMIAEGIICNQKVRLIKPITYMNNSGIAVRGVVDYYNIDINNVIVIYDELDIPFPNIRIRKNGSSGGHNGMKSIIQHLGTEEIKRIRIGIGPKKEDVIDFVLSPFSKADQKELVNVFEKAPKIMEDYISKGIDFIMNNYNG